MSRRARRSAEHPRALVIDAIRRDRPRLVLLSFLMLFVELGLIRWTGAYNVYLSFFTNFILLASFLGVGVGFLRGNGRRDLFRFAPIALAALALFQTFRG